MKKLIALFLLVQLFQSTAKAQEGIKFIEGTFNEALAKAKDEHKLVFIDCFTSWCGPCKWMAAHVFTNDTVSNYFNKTFVCCKLDMEKGEGPEIAKKYAVKNYPTYLWIDANGKQIHRAVGSMPVASFMKIAENAISADNNLAWLEEQYKSGNRKPSILLAYAYALRDANNTQYQTVADDYFRTQSAEDLSNETNWKTILEFTPNLNSSVYTSITKNPEPFYKRYGKDSVRHVLDNLALESMNYAAQHKDSALLAKAVAQLSHSKDKNMRKDVAHRELGYYKLNNMMNTYTALAHSYAKKYFWDDAKALNEICWMYFMRVDEKPKLADAEKWIEQSVKLNDSYYNTDTYANILHKEGKNQEALAMAKHSISLAKKSPEDYGATQELLDKIIKEEGSSNIK